MPSEDTKVSTLIRMEVLRLLTDGEQKACPTLKSTIQILYIDEIWHSYSLHKEDPKHVTRVTYPLSSAHISIFHPRSQNLTLSRNIKMKKKRTNLCIWAINIKNQ